VFLEDVNNIEEQKGYETYTKKRFKGNFYCDKIVLWQVLKIFFNQKIIFCTTRER